MSDRPLGDAVDQEFRRLVSDIASVPRLTPELDELHSPVLTLEGERTMGTTVKYGLVAAVAAAVAIIVGLVLFIDAGDEGGIETIDAPVDTAALAGIGERLVTAFDERDTDTVAELIADDAVSINMFGAFTKSDVLALIPWMEASGMRLESPRCEGSDPDQVACSPIQSMRWAAAAGAVPKPGTMFLKVEDGQVTALRYSRPAFGFQHDRFSEFIRDIDPTAPQRMWYTADDGQPYAILNEESYGLFEKYTEEFWEFRRG